MTSTQKLAKQYDHVIVGYNTASLSFAYELAKKGQNFCLLDSVHFNSRPVKTMPSLECLVATRPTFNSVIDGWEDDVLRDIFGEIRTLEGPPTTFEKGNFKSFLGFGSEKIVALEAVEPFCQTQHWHPTLSIENFWDKALSVVAESLFLDQQVTDIEQQDHEILSLTLNGKSQVKGNQFYFFDHFPFLFETVGPSVKKIASRFGKAKWYSSVNLVIHHKGVEGELEADQFYLLMGSKNQPCLGEFSQIRGEWVSRWESFFPAELTIDSETTGTYLKEIKKQVKRAFPEWITPEVAEQILIHDNVYAPLHSGGVENGILGDFKNLSIYSDLMAPGLGWMSQVLVGRLAAQDLTNQSEKNSPAPVNEVAAPSTPC